MPIAESHPVGRTLVLHLLPGALAAAFFFIIGPSLTGAGYPPQLALTLAILFVIIPFELGYLLYEGKRLTGVVSVRPGDSIPRATCATELPHIGAESCRMECVRLHHNGAT